jgi:hypothetical protein
MWCANIWCHPETTPPIESWCGLSGDFVSFWSHNVVIGCADWFQINSASCIQRWPRVPVILKDAEVDQWSSNFTGEPNLLLELCFFFASLRQWCPTGFLSLTHYVPPSHTSVGTGDGKLTANCHCLQNHRSTNPNRSFSLRFQTRSERSGMQPTNDWKCLETLTNNKIWGSQLHLYPIILLISD